MAFDVCTRCYQRILPGSLRCRHCGADTREAISEKDTPGWGDNTINTKVVLDGPSADQEVTEEALMTEISDSPQGMVHRTLQIFRKVEEEAARGEKPNLVDAMAWYFNFSPEHREAVRHRDPELVARVLERMVLHWRSRRSKPPG